jgi:hypothetical protein
MTHGRGESDSAIVAGKPTNKAERSATEPVEPRAEAEGNASQQSTGRAQSRETVSQALERIRQAARQRKKEKFTALLHHINAASLRLAFFALKRDAAPGVDGLTWRTYEADLDRNLTDLHSGGPTGSIPGTAIAPNVHTKGRWETAPTGGGDVGCIMHLVQFEFGVGEAMRGESATQSRSL